ncbi:hypothetical protein CH379_010715 [Leptospira ellisii]|uniref:Uncharacterized protein n=1 Tax=Leptospira ellisii TaxID=2023197 RepID=A0AAE4QN65_9LEPT|nr:hypothetical protein [Leptospira ellisii]MDV6236094.1 hypothetical protein [Leptospira ellisii]
MNIQEIKFTISLTNVSAEEIGIYPDVALFTGISGWGGPSFGIEISPASFRELRNYYGPPAQPPNRAFYEKNEILLSPNESFRKTLTACWIPRSAISRAAVASENLDPEGMDSVDPILFRKSSFLVLGKGSEQVLREMNSRPDFLRPNSLLVFQHSGTYEFSVSYLQSEWVEFRPRQSSFCRSSSVSVNVE